MKSETGVELRHQHVFKAPQVILKHSDNWEALFPSVPLSSNFLLLQFTFSKQVPILLPSGTDLFGWGNREGEERAMSMFLNPLGNFNVQPGLGPTLPDSFLTSSRLFWGREREQIKEENKGEPMKSLENQTITELYPLTVEVCSKVHTDPHTRKKPRLRPQPFCCCECGTWNESFPTMNLKWLLGKPLREWSDNQLPSIKFKGQISVGGPVSGRSTSLATSAWSQSF